MNADALKTILIFKTLYPFLTGIKMNYEYVDNKRTDKVKTTVVNICSPQDRLKTFAVQLEGEHTLNVSEEELDKACSSLQPIYVTFEGVTQSAYSTEGTRSVSYSYKAKSVRLATKNEVEDFYNSDFFSDE